MGDVIELFRKVDRLLQLEEKHGRAIQALEAQRLALKDRMAALEAREAMLIVEATSAARTASGHVTQASISDVSRRLGRVEAVVEARRTALQDGDADGGKRPGSRPRRKKGAAPPDTC